MGKGLVSDELWEILEPLLTAEPPKPKGGRPRVDDRAALGGIVFVLKSGIPGRCSPRRWAAGPARAADGGCATGRRPGCGDACTGSCSTALAKPTGSAGRGRAWTRRACRQKGGERIGKNPTDRGKPGSKRHLVSDRKGVPLTVALTAPNAHDSKVFEELLDGIEPIKHPGRGRPRKRPEKLHADKGYDFPRCRKALRRRGIKGRIARRGVESGEKLGRHRWVVERTLAWLARYRRLSVRYERRSDIHEAFLHLGCLLICLNHLP